MKKLLALTLLTSQLNAHQVTFDQQQIKSTVKPTVKSEKIDPLSKITVTSPKAIGKVDQHNKKVFTFSYQGGVKTVFADGSEITSQQLDLCIDKDGVATKDVVSSLTKEVRHDIASQLKKISFINNVCIKHNKQTILADTVDLDPQKRCCTLQGNVSVSQNKVKNSDVPISMKSDKAILSLDTGTVTFLGSRAKPVNTVINITNVNLFEKKEKSKKKKREQNQSPART